ncbi:hypothetical protein [Kitasatospora sp. NPDC059673]|uniref:hypothetical protein n=1 Tax=Kitasatospora sp. NPDC059673 TaxID=3346901 RepID=UPI0036A90692
MIAPGRLGHVLAAPLLLAALTACTSSTPAASPAPVGSTPATISVAEAGEKLTPYRPAGPEGSTQAGGVLDLDGTVDVLIGASGTDAKADMQRRLAQRGFVVAARHSWTAPDGRRADTLLMRFSADPGAEGLAGTLAQDLRSINPDTAFTDPSDLSTGVVVNTPDSRGRARVALVAPHGDVVVLNYLTPATPDKRTAMVLFHTELGLLPTPGIPW